MTSVMFRVFRIVLGMTVLVSLPLNVLAAEPPVSVGTTTSFVNALQMLLALGIVLAAIAGTAWVLKRMTPGQAGNSSGIRVVSAVAVGPKERVVLVDVSGTRLVLGVAPGQVTKLMELPLPESPEDLPDTVSPFMGKLKEFLASQREQK